MIRKKNQWLFALPLALLLLTGLAVLAFFYLLPRHLKQNELPEWLERNQRHFRIGGIASGSYNAVRIRLFSIGDPDAPLLIAPEAELFFDYPAERSFQKPRFKELRLREVPLKVDLVQNQLRINGHPAADFITGLTELPAGPDGGFIQLTLESLLLLPGRQTPAPCLIRVEREAQSGCFTFQGEWQSDGRQGTWHARLNRAKGEITFRVAGALTVDFLQEFLLRAKLPRGLATFIRGGDLQGQGSFSADFPALQLKLLRFNGTLRGGALNWYGSTFEPVRPLTFAFAGTPEALELSWNDLAVAAPAPVSIQNFQLQYHARRSHSTFTARADVGSALLRSIDRRFGASWQSLRPMTARLSGRVNWHTGDWQCANQDEALPSRDWLMKGAGEEQLALTANQFTFSGKGTGCRGRYSAALSFQDMEFQYGHGSWRSPKGELRGNWRFTGRAGQPGIVFEFNLDKLSADTPHGQLELGSPAGELDFRPAPGGQNEFYLIARAESYNLLHSLLQLNGGRIQTEISALRNDADGRFAVQSCDLSGDAAELRLPGHSVKLIQPELRGAAVFSPDCGVQEAEWNFQAGQITGGEINFTKPEIKLVRSNRGAPSLWHGDFSFKHGLLGAAPLQWKIFDGKLQASGRNFFSLPDEVKFSAADFRPVRNRWYSEWNNTVWQLKRVAETRDYTGVVTAESLHLEGPSGKGSAGGTRLDFQITADAAGRPEAGKIQIDTGNPAWSFATQQFGGEHLTGSIAFSAENFVTQAKIRNATLIDRHLSLLAPEVDFSGKGASAAGFDGQLKFSGGSASSDITNLEGSQVSLDMSFSAAVPADRPFPDRRGTLSVGKLSFLGRPEGSLEAALTQTSGGLQAVGKLFGRRFENSVLDFDARLTWEPRYLKSTFAMPTAKLREPFELVRWFPGCHGTLLAGEFALDGSVESTPDGGRFSATIQADNSDWQFGNALLEGVSGTMRFADLRRLVSGNDAELRARRFRWHGWELQDNLFQLALPGKHTAAVSSWQGRFQTGSVRLAEPVRFIFGPAESAPLPLRFALEKVPLDSFLADLGIDAVEGSAALSGTVQAEYERDTLRFRDSAVGFRAPAGELLKFGSLERYAVTISDASYQAFTLAVLKAMRCTSADFRFQHDDNVLNMQIKAEGVPASPVPFVYQGHSAPTPFRPAAPGERGFDGELELLVNLKLNAAPGLAPSAPQAGQ